MTKYFIIGDDRSEDPEIIMVETIAEGPAFVARMITSKVATTLTEIGPSKVTKIMNKRIKECLNQHKTQ